MGDRIRVGFMGNPNCGKTTLFNAYTGANLKVANWPGVTVEKVEGSMKFQGYDLQLVDLPGTYSLTSYTMEEVVARQYVQSDEVDVIIDVADASALERNLYLTLQLIELGKPVVLALNMMDIVEKRGMEIDLHRLPEMLGIPVIPVSARKKKGLDILMHAVIHHKDFLEKQPLIHHHDTHSAHPHQHHKEFVMVYSDEIEDKIDLLKEQFARFPRSEYVVCQKNGQPFTPDAFSRKFQRFLSRNHFPHLRLHDLRHASATLMIEHGVDIKTVQSRLGHSDISTTLNIYSHMTEQMNRNAADKLDEVLFSK